MPYLLIFISYIASEQDVQMQRSPGAHELFQHWRGYAQGHPQVPRPEARHPHLQPVLPSQDQQGILTAAGQRRWRTLGYRGVSLLWTCLGYENCRILCSAYSQTVSLWVVIETERGLKTSLGNVKHPDLSYIKWKIERLLLASGYLRPYMLLFILGENWVMLPYRHNNNTLLERLYT